MHKTVFKVKAIDYLQIQPDAWYVDATFGAGGHSSEMLAKGARVIAFDYDEKAIFTGYERFAQQIRKQQLLLIRENFDRLQLVVEDLYRKKVITEIRGVLFDFGTSTDQLLLSEVGLSFNQRAPLDMRLDQRLEVKAVDLLLALPEKQLANLFFEYGGELESRKIAKAIVIRREKYGPKAFETTLDLVSVIMANKKSVSQHIHPATKVFQALRIAVNDEIANLERALPQAFRLLTPLGRLVTIAFHEGEDRPVKRFMRECHTLGKGFLVEKKPLMPDGEELKNPRARSAKMRILEKI
jgi:16S rRNA (cytosine1402-N4)-methyltransferase